MWPCPDGVAAWTDWYLALTSGETGARWELGEMTTEELAAILAAELGIAAGSVIAHIQSRCGDLRFFEHAWAAARARTLPQAIVTLNPDVFTRFVSPNYQLESVFDVIVTSWEEQTRDKARLCEIALERLGGSDRATALLIDNIEANVDAWRALGGQAYWFRSDEEFGRDAAGLLPAEHS
jgi:FMN phosphatase YigB (HAD superfamily)